MLNGIVLVCDRKFQVREFIYNSFQNKNWKDKDFYIGDICDSEEKQKILEFTRNLDLDGATFNWEINVTFEDHLKTLKFSGSKFDESYFIFALETNNDVPFLYEELMRINNEQANYLRMVLKEKFLKNNEIRYDDETFEELTKLNNELANLQRELAKKNAELTRLNKIKNQFLGMAAHDLRNPLGNIFNFAELLEDEPENLNTQQLKFISHIKNQSLFMLNLVNDLLDYSAIESGKINLNLKLENISDLISETLLLINNLARKKEIIIHFNKQQKAAELLIDRGKIEQVITNLITNAIKYSKPNTEIFISVIEKAGEYIVEVTDNGEGIKEEEVSTLFMPFKRTSTQSTAGEKSTGLGLFICKQIIEAHNGKIWAKSKLGIGSTFSFSLPKS